MEQHHVSENSKNPNEGCSIDSVRMVSARSLKSLKKGANKPDFTDSYVTQRLHKLSPGDLYLFPDEYTDINEDNLTSAKIFVEEGPMGESMLGVSRSQSIRNVRFGRLALYSLDNTPVHGHVAIKPARSIECAVREASASMMINDSDLDIETYTPVGFLRTAEQSVSLLTRYVGKTYSFDNVLWRNPEIQYEDEVVDALAKSAISLATFHGGLGMTHGDFQPKNTAWDPKHDKPWAIDLEEAVKHIEREALSFSDRALEDVAALMLTQPMQRSKDMYAMVADKYVDEYRQVSDGQMPPISRDSIVQLANQPLRTPHIVNR